VGRRVGIIAALALLGVGLLWLPLRAQEAVPEARGTRLQGTAYLGRNRDVVGATITVRDEADPASFFLTTTDEKGRFRVGELPNGSYSVEVRREGLASVFKSGVVLRFPFRAVVEVPMEPISSGASAVADEPEGTTGFSDPVSVSGEARDLDGALLREVSVRVIKSGGGVDPRRVATASDGSFVIDDIRPGNWRLEVRGIGFLPMRTSVDLIADSNLELWMVQQPASYLPSPLDLMPEEEPIPPEGLGPRVLVD